MQLEKKIIETVQKHASPGDSEVLQICEEYSCWSFFDLSDILIENAMTDIKPEFDAMGVTNRFDIAKIMIVTFHRYLHNKPIFLQQQVAMLEDYV